MTETREEYAASKEETAGAVKQIYHCYVHMVGKKGPPPGPENLHSDGPYYYNIEQEGTNIKAENTKAKLRTMALDAAHALGKDITFKIETK